MPGKEHLLSELNLTQYRYQLVLCAFVFFFVGFCLFWFCVVFFLFYHKKKFFQSISTLKDISLFQDVIYVERDLEGIL